MLDFDFRYWTTYKVVKNIRYSSEIQLINVVYATYYIKYLLSYDKYTYCRILYCKMSFLNTHFLSPILTYIFDN